MFRILLAVALLVAPGLAGAVAAASAAAGAPVANDDGTHAPSAASREASRAERLVMGLEDVKAWTAAVRAAGRGVAIREDADATQPRCRAITLYEDAGAYLTRFGTWRVCGAKVRKLRDD